MGIQELLNKASEITQTDYNHTIDEYNIIDTLVVALDEIIREYEYLYKKFNEYEDYINDNFKPITKEEQIYG
jgi:hypothetical protein